MRPQVTIDLESYAQLLEDSRAFKDIEAKTPFIHYQVWEGLGGLRTQITSNDERLNEIKNQNQQDVDYVRKYKDHEIRKLKDELESIKSRGFFKRLFS